jgi:predicted small metal-binding protein
MRRRGLRVLAAGAGMEENMARMVIDCREFPSEMNCTVSIAADTERELVEAAVQHAVAVHGHTDNAELRGLIRQAIRVQDGA